MKEFYSAQVIWQKYIEYTVVRSSNILSYLFHIFFRRCSFKTAVMSRFLKVAIASSNFMNNAYDGRLALELSVSILKEINLRVTSFSNETLKILHQKVLGLCMSIVNLFAETQLKLLNERVMTNILLCSSCFTEVH